MEPHAARRACMLAVAIRTSKIKKKKLTRLRPSVPPGYHVVSLDTIENKAKRYLQENIGMTRGVTMYCAALIRTVYEHGNQGNPWALGYFETRMRLLARCVRGCKTPRDAASIIVAHSDKRLRPFRLIETRLTLWCEYE
jgi:hypothetical protein